MKSWQRLIIITLVLSITQVMTYILESLISIEFVIATVNRKNMLRKEKLEAVFACFDKVSFL